MAAYEYAALQYLKIIINYGGYFAIQHDRMGNVTHPEIHSEFKRA
jgi:hypothetical protein